MRDSRRTRRPKRMIGATTNGTLASTISESLAFVMKRSTTPPTNIRMFLSAIDTDEPITVCRSVVSVVIRDCISLGALVSKNPG